MTKRACPASVWLLGAALASLCFGSLAIAGETPAKRGGAGPSDPPPGYKDPEPKQIDGPSVVEGQAAGIDVGQYAPDFELQPIEAYTELRRWLGDDAPESIEQKVQLSQLVGKAPILLLYGSYT